MMAHFLYRFNSDLLSWRFAGLGFSQKPQVLRQVVAAACLRHSRLTSGQSRLKSGSKEEEDGLFRDQSLHQAKRSWSLFFASDKKTTRSKKN